MGALVSVCREQGRLRGRQQSPQDGASRDDESDSVCHDILGWLYLQVRSFELAEHHKRRALALTPNSPEHVACMGVLDGFLGKPDEAIDWFAQARRLDPYYEPAWFWRMQGIAHFVACRHSEAIICFNRSPTSPLWLDAYLAACHALIDERWQAKELAAKVLDRDPDFSARRLVLKEPYRRQTDADHLLEGLRRAYLPE